MQPDASAEHLQLDEGASSWRVVGEEVVALDLRADEYVAARGAAVVLWPLLEAGTTRDALAAALVDRYGVEPARARADVDAFVGALAARGLLR